MKLSAILTLALAALTLTPAAAQKRGKKAKAPKPVATVPAAETIPAAVEAKTFSYAMGVAQGESLKQYLTSQMGVDTAYVKYAIEAMTTSVSEEDRKRIEATAAGLRIAEMNRRNLPFINKQACGKEDSTFVDIAEFERGLSEAALGKAALSQDSAMKTVEQQFKHQQASYKKANLDWLDANKKLKGVKTLPSGLQYRVLTEGNGPVATDSSEVEVHYEGKLIDGTVFDSSYKRNQPATFRPNQVIKGWTEALTLMPEGSVWELYIPASLGYGEQGSGRSIPGNSTLIFKVEALKVKPTETK
ncbi:MAG: FKBP-type peptidyl-prolyl cis-trans isomerase [Alloprevotella sp.]|nr:FKBP-type peptidyl-prolyl cis-trans isomerase [Alloprevotella sp.]